MTEYESRRDMFAAAAMQGLMANPERYRYIETLIGKGALSQDEATYKNVQKAFKIADAMLDYLEKI